MISVTPSSTSSLFSISLYTEERIAELQLKRTYNIYISPNLNLERNEANIYKSNNCKLKIQKLLY